VLSNPVTVVERSPITIPFARRLNFSGTSTILQKDQARAKALLGHAEAKLSGRAVISTPPISNQVVTYVAAVGIGSPATTCGFLRILRLTHFHQSCLISPSDQLIVDTGSSNTWVGAGKPYVRTGTSSPTPNTVVCPWWWCFGIRLLTEGLDLRPSLMVQDRSLVGMHVLRIHCHSTGAPGTEYIDEVTLGPGLVILRQSIGEASTSSGFAGVDGILGYP
jgi:cathepsin E